MRKLSLLAVAGPVLFTAASLLLESAAAARGGIPRLPYKDASLSDRDAVRDQGRHSGVSRVGRQEDEHHVCVTRA